MAHGSRLQREKDALLLEPDPPRPYGWIQWKGTNACMDLYCTCGEQFHIDDIACYYVKCTDCGQVYACNGYFKLTSLYYEPTGTKIDEDQAEAKLVEDFIGEKND